MAYVSKYTLHTGAINTESPEKVQNLHRQQKTVISSDPCSWLLPVVSLIMVGRDQQYD
jgi:hypothetical protein